jgi:phosphoserine phosphatase RsbU/P
LAGNFLTGAIVPLKGLWKSQPKDNMPQTKIKKVLSGAAFSGTLSVFLVIAVIYLINIIHWKDNPNFGFEFRTSMGIHVIGVVNDYGRMAGLQVGDLILDINNKTYSSIKELQNILNIDLGAENLLHIQRSGKELYITIKNIPYGIQRSLATSGVPLLLGVCYGFIGVIVFLMKPHVRSSWIFLMFSLTFGLFIIYLRTSGKILPLWFENPKIFAYCFTPAVLIHLAWIVPKEREAAKKHPIIQLIPYLASFTLFVLIRQATDVLSSAPTALLNSVLIFILVGVVFFVCSCVQLRLSKVSYLVNLRARIILLGFAFSILVPLFDLVANVIFDFYLMPSSNYYLPFLLAFPASVAYSIVKHGLFDIDAIIKRTYGYLLTTGTLAGIYGLFVLVLNLTFGVYDFARSQIFPIIFILAVVSILNPVRDRVQRLIDRVFYRLEYDYQRTVHKISESMRSLLNLNQIGRGIMDTALGTIFIDHGYVLLLERGGKAFTCLVKAGIAENKSQGEGSRTSAETSKACGLEVAELQLSAEEPLIRKMAETGKEVTVYDIEEDPAFRDSRGACRQTFERMQVQLLVPIIYEHRLIGLIALGRKKSGKFYRREDINLLNVLANQSAVAIENARMVEEVIEKERMEEELSIARDLQVSMLPAECPQIAGFEIAAYSLAAREVGGDFYDFIEMSGGRLGMVVGDVTGKSVSGALVVSACRSVIRMLSEEELTVAERMMRANRRLKQDLKAGMFVALLHAVLEGKAKTIALCNAGQTQPIFCKAKTGSARLIETKGDSFPLGILNEAEYKETVLELSPGDVIVFYTDGIVEAFNPEGKIFGFDRLIETIEVSSSNSAESLVKKILDEVKAFAAGSPQHDDLSLIIVRAKA